VAIANGVSAVDRARHDNALPRTVADLGPSLPLLARTAFQQPLAIAAGKQPTPPRTMNRRLAPPARDPAEHELRPAGMAGLSASI
jgi:hypothetical protein